MKSRTLWRIVAGKLDRVRTVSSLRPGFRWLTSSNRVQALNAKPKRRTTASSPNYRQQWSKFQQTNKPGYLELNDRDVIKAHSLAETLQAHRDANANRAPIQRVESTGPGPLPAEQPSYDAQHIELDRVIRKTNRPPLKEYEATPRTLSFDWVLIGDVDRYLRMPWMKELDSMSHLRQKAGDRLTAEIRAADRFLTPSANELLAAREAQRDLTTWTKRIFPTFAKYTVMGSRATGMSSPTSDIDVRVHFKSAYSDSRDNKEMLGALFLQMRQNAKGDVPFVMSYYLSHTRIPLIALTHGPTGLEIQIQCAGEEPGNEDVIRGLSAEYLSLKPLFRILKHALKIRGCTSGQHGGLTSYPLLIMIAVSLKMNVLEVNQTDLGRNLLNFLKFWSEIDFYKNAIVHVPCDPLGYLAPPVDLKDLFGTTEAAERTITAIIDDPVGARPVLFEKSKVLGNYHSPVPDFMMVLYDPADPDNDLGWSAHLIKHIQATFMKILQEVEADMAHYNEAGVSANRMSFLRHLIEGDYSLYNIERKRVRPSANFNPQSVPE